jgi:hypothetical protein
MKETICGVVAVVSLLAAAERAEARSRQFYCGEESFVTLRALNANTLAAGPINGKTVALTQVPQKQMTYVYGQTAVEIAPDQKSIRIVVPGGEPITCVWPTPAGVTAPSGGQQPQGNTSANAAPITSNGAATTNKQGTTGNQAAATGSGGFTAKSWGGVVRSGPAMDSKKLASLTEGERILVIESSGVEMNGYPWFKIRYRGNNIGYQWGGIICPVGKPVAGTFQKCD